MHKNTWKQGERRVAAFFGSERTPLSGGNSKMTRSDSLHDKLFIESKHRKVHAVRTLHDETAALAKKEDKVPIVALIDKNKPGFLICVHSSNLNKFIEAYIGTQWPIKRDTERPENVG